MNKVFISYDGADSEAAMLLANQLRAKGVDVFIDYQRMMNPPAFTKRLESEIRARECVVLVQSATALRSPLVQAELEFAYGQQFRIIPVAVAPLDVRETSEFRFLLHMNPIDFAAWRQRAAAAHAVDQLIARLNTPTDNKITVHNASRLVQTATLDAHAGFVRTISYAPDGSLMASSGADNSIRLLDARHHPPQPVTVLTEHDGLAWGVVFAPRHPYMAAAANDGTVRLWDLNTVPDVYEFTRLAGYDKPVYTLDFSADGALIATGSSDNIVRIHDLTDIAHTGQAPEITKLLHAGQVYWVAFSPDNRLLASTSRDSTVRLWEIDYDNLSYDYAPKPYVLSAHKSWVNSATFAPHGLLLASASNDATVRLWDVQHRDVIGVLKGHTEGVNMVAFAADGSFIASASKDGTVRLWDLNSLSTVAVLEGHRGAVNALAFAPDGYTLATGAADGVIRLWQVAV